MAPSVLVRFLLTMDCERVPKSEFYPAGPRSWKESERNIEAFADVAAGLGFRVTFFAVPEAVEAHADLFKALIRAGHEVGLHLHPHTFRHGVNEYLANLPAERQRALIAEARDAFAEAIGFPPTSFRPGHFSANAVTFELLSELGFRRGSSAIPGRNLAGTGGNWSNWGRHCRWVGDFFEVPVTVHHLGRPAWLMYRARHLVELVRRGFVVDAVRGAAGTLWGSLRAESTDGAVLADLRIEEGCCSLTNAILFAEADRLSRSGEFAVVTALTHSYVNYSLADERPREHGMSRRLHLARMLADASRATGCRFESRTLTELQREFESSSPEAVRAMTAPAPVAARGDRTA